MTRQEAEYLYGWLQNTYPRNYRDADLRQKATTIDNLAKVFAHNTYKDVQEEYERVFASQKNEPHPSEIRAALKQETRQTVARASVDPLQSLKQHPEWDQLCRAYGEKEVKRQAKLCVETGTIGELKFRLERDQ